jgi:DNA primase
MSVADEVKSKLDIVDYIQRFVSLRKAGRSYKACCPFHSERTPSFVVDPDRQSWRCFGACGTGGDIFAFAMKQQGWSFSEALNELGKLAGVEVRQQTPEQRQQSDKLDGLRGLLAAAADAYHAALFKPDVEGAPAALRYARAKRGLSDDTLRKFGVGYAPPGWRNMLEHLQTLGYTEEQIIEAGIATRNEDKYTVYDRFRHRLMIPIRDERGRVIGFGARALNPDDNPKYLNSPQSALFDKSRTLFGLDVAKTTIRTGETAVIVEGYMDAIQAHQAGFANVVAQMGTALTETQLKLIAPRWAKQIILALDSDAAGQNATLRSLEVARQTLQADYTGRLAVDMRVLHIPDAKDPDDLIRETPARWAELVAQAIPVADYVIETEAAGLPPNAPVQAREAVARRLLPILLASENNLYTKYNLQKLALKLRITERDLLAWADERQKIERARAPYTRPSQPARVFPPLEPPDLPPLDETDRPPASAVEPPPDDAPLPEPERSVARIAARPVAQDVPVERHCLRLLFQQPDGYYVVNRKLRELANADARLLSGPLADWDAEDFSHIEYRALMTTFAYALAQDEMEPLDYLRARADAALQMQLDAIMMDELDRVRIHLRDTLQADLAVCWGQTRHARVDGYDEIIEKALRLRIQRLQRERETLFFLQMDAQTNQDMDAEIQFQGQIVLSITAKQLIEAELQKQLSAVRE